MKNDLDKIRSQYKDYITDERNDWNFVKENEQHLIADYQGETLKVQMQVSQFAEGIMVSRMLGSGDGVITANVTNFSHVFTLLINVSGIIHLTLETGQKIIIKPWEVWLIRGDWGNFHEEIISVDSEISSLYIYLSQEKTLQWSHENLIPKSIFTPDKCNTTQFIRISDDILYIKEACKRLINLPYECDGLSHLEIESAVLNLLVSLFQNSASHQSNQKSKVDSIVDDVIEIILGEYMHPLTIEKLAQYFDTNEYYLKKVFKERTGLTIANYIRRHRLEVAFEMIVSGDSIQNSMLCVGYHHKGYFNKIFKKQYGFTPKNLKL